MSLTPCLPSESSSTHLIHFLCVSDCWWVNNKSYSSVLRCRLNFVNIEKVVVKKSRDPYRISQNNSYKLMIIKNELLKVFYNYSRIINQ